ncbi:hypothetical protein PMAYCL1PPCAC_15644, partial [Pristionchus mayeri]
LSISANIVSIFFTIRQSKALSADYIRLLLILKTCSLFIVGPLFPCVGIFMKGIGVYLGISAHSSLVMNFTTVSIMSALFNCCLFHRQQVILPYDHPMKLRQRGVYCVYLVMNLVMIFNPISFIFTTKDDREEQGAVIAKTPMSWLLQVSSFKIYTNDNCPLMMLFHFPLMLITFGLCTLTTTMLTQHATRVMNARRDQISAATITMQQRLISSLQFQSSRDFILDTLRIRKSKVVARRRVSTNAFTTTPNSS